MATERVKEFLTRVNWRLWNFRSQFSAIPEFDFEAEGVAPDDPNFDDDDNEEGGTMHHPAGFTPAHFEQSSFTPIKWTPQRLLALAVSGFIGAALGVVVAAAVNSALVEIVVSSTFSLYFGIIFVVIGLIVMWRTMAQPVYIPPDEQQRAKLPRMYLLSFACLNAATGLICFLVSHETLLSLPLLARLIAFALLGMSAAFALTFGIVDLLNLAVGVCRPDAARPLVESILQIYVVVGTALVMGLIFGCLFGCAPLNPDQPLASLAASSSGAAAAVSLANMVDPRLSLPIGIILGGAAGVATEYSRRLEASFNKLDDPIQFEYDI